MIVYVTFGQKYDHFTVNNGLPANMVYRISQDSKGFIWIITERGIARYDGSDFKVYGTKDGLPTNDIWEMAITKDDRVWYFSKSASMGYIQNDSIYDFPSTEVNTILFPSNISEQANEVTFGYNQVWYGLENNRWEVLDEARDASSGYHKQHRELLNQYLSESNEEFGRGIYRYIDSLAIVFLPSRFAVLNAASDKITSFDYPDEIKARNFSFFRAHKVNGEIQLTGQGFVSNLDLELGMTNLELFPEELDSHFSFKDRFGNFWLASLTKGVYKLAASKKDVVYGLQQQRVRRVESTPVGVIASITDKGFYLIGENANAELISEGDGFVYNTSYLPETKSTYLLSAKEIMSIDEFGNRRIHKASARNLVYYDGHLFGNVSGGLIKFTKGLKRIEMYREVGIKTLAVWNDDLYLGTSSGLKRYTGTSIEAIDDYPEIKNKPILDLYSIDSEHMIVSTDGFGVYLLDRENAGLLEGSDYSSANQISFSDGEIWLATDSGILIYGIEGNSAEYKKRMGIDEGLPNPVINSLLLKGDNVIVGTDTGMAIVRKDRVAASQISHIYVSEATMNGQSLVNGESVRYSEDEPLNINIGLVDLGNNVDAGTYSYMLEPAQGSWTQTKASNLSFSSLSPGDYVLRIKAGTVENSYSFSILPLWWQRDLSIIGIGIALVLLIVFGLQQYRKRELKKKMSKLEIQNKLTEFELYALRSQMNPHFVFNSLAAIQYCINNKQVELAEKYLVKFSRLVRQFFEQSKKKEVDIESEVALLRNYLDIEKLRFKDKLEYSIRVSPELASKNPNIPTMLLQPIVENAINHGIFNKRNGGRVDIDFALQGESMLKVEIADDGVGMAATVKPLNGKRNSSDVLNERIGFLNKSGNWNISYNDQPAFPEKVDQGNITTFLIKNQA